jgi:hypothetical protein
MHRKVGYSREPLHLPPPDFESGAAQSSTPQLDFCRWNVAPRAARTLINEPPDTGVSEGVSGVESILAAGSGRRS